MIPYDVIEIILDDLLFIDVVLCAYFLNAIVCWHYSVASILVASLLVASLSKCLMNGLP